MNGNFLPHLPRSISQPKSGRMAGVQRRGRSPATVSPMIFNELNPRCRSARSFCEFLKYERKKAENDTPLNTIQTRQDVFKIRLDKIKKRQEKNKISLDVFTLLVSSVYEACFIDQRDLQQWLMRLAASTHETCSVNIRSKPHQRGPKSFIRHTTNQHTKAHFTPFHRKSSIANPEPIRLHLSTLPPTGFPLFDHIPPPFPTRNVETSDSAPDIPLSTSSCL